MMRAATLAIAGVLLLLGLLGIIPPIHEPYPTDQPRLEVRNAIGMIFGIIPSNLPLTLLHLLTGAIGLALLRRPPRLRTYLRVVSVVFGALMLLGAMPPTSTLWGTLPLYGIIMWTHMVVAVVAFWTGWPVPPDADEPLDLSAMEQPLGLTSRATLGGRPVHPMLVPYPIAFVTGALATDLAYWWTTLPWYNGYIVFWSRASLWLLAAAVTTGVIAALVGTIDFFGVRRVRHLRAARVHALGGLTILCLAAINLSLRFGDPASHTLPLGISLSAASVVLLAVTVWHGNILVYRNRVGVRGYGVVAVTVVKDAGVRHVAVADPATLPISVTLSERGGADVSQDAPLSPRPAAHAPPLRLAHEPVIPEGDSATDTVRP
jgi:uncharacterized membrane protein